MSEEIREAAYWSAVWSVAAVCSVSRCIRDRDFISIGHTCSVGSVGGFLGFAVVTLSGGQYSDAEFNGTFWLGVAAVVGLAGREQTELIGLIWRGMLTRLFPKGDDGKDG